MEMKILDIYFNRIEFDTRQEEDNKSKITNRSNVCACVFTCALSGKIMISHPQTHTHTHSSMHKSTRCKQSNVLNQLVSQPTKTHDK